MVSLPKLDLTGFTTILAGLLFLLTGILLYLNTSSTISEPVNPGIFKLLGAMTALIGAILLVSKDD